MNCRKIFPALLITIFIFSSCNSQEVTNSFIINTMNVRLREQNNIDSLIIQVLNKGDMGKYLEKKGNERNPEFSVFNWFNVTINGKMGWIYGEFLNLNDDKLRIKKNGLTNSNELQVLIDSNTIYVGMKKEDLLMILGTPEKEENLEEQGVTCLYYFSGKLYFEIDDYMKCLKYIKIEEPSIMLASGVHVGTSVDELIQANGIENFRMDTSSITPKIIYAPNYNMWYTPWVSFGIDGSRIINSIYVSLNIE